MSFAQSLLVYFIIPVLNVIKWVVIIEIVLSWLVAFRVVQPGGTVSQVAFGLRRFTDPLLNPIRRFIPPLGGLDLSPVVLILFLQWFTSYFLIGIVYPMLG